MTDTVASPDDEWPILLGSLFSLKQEIAAVESEPFIGFTIAKVRAAPDDLVAAERRLGALPPGLAQFYLHANGWPGLYFALDLLGVDDVLTGSDAVLTDPVMGSYVEFESLPIEAGKLLVVGSSSAMADRVLVVGTGDDSYHAGTTFWVDEESLQTYDNFADFFASVIGQHRIHLTRVQAQQNS